MLPEKVWWEHSSPLTQRDNERGTRNNRRADQRESRRSGKRHFIWCGIGGGEEGEGRRRRERRSITKVPSSPACPSDRSSMNVVGNSILK